jgi:hypothetical protein
MPELPRPGQKVRWRNPLDARRRGWEDVFGTGPFHREPQRPRPLPQGPALAPYHYAAVSFINSFH